MSYFRELPNIKYPSFLSEKNSSLEYVDVKNFFRRVKLRSNRKFCPSDFFLVCISLIKQEWNWE